MAEKFVLHVETIFLHSMRASRTCCISAEGGVCQRQTLPVVGACVFDADTRPPLQRCNMCAKPACCAKRSSISSCSSRREEHEEIDDLFAQHAGFAHMLHLCRGGRVSASNPQNVHHPGPLVARDRPRSLPQDLDPHRLNGESQAMRASRTCCISAEGGVCQRQTLPVVGACVHGPFAPCQQRSLHGGRRHG
jgi:hypothetical protein